MLELIAGGGLFRRVPPALRPGDKVLGVGVAKGGQNLGADIDGGGGAQLLHQLFKLGDIGLDVLPATAVIRLQEAVHQRVHIGLRVPQQLGQQIGAQLAELAALIRIALFKNTVTLFSIRNWMLGCRTLKFG